MVKLYIHTTGVGIQDTRFEVGKLKNILLMGD